MPHSFAVISPNMAMWFAELGIRYKDFVALISQISMGPSAIIEKHELMDLLIPMTGPGIMLSCT